MGGAHFLLRTKLIAARNNALGDRAPMFSAKTCGVGKPYATLGSTPSK